MPCYSPLRALRSSEGIKLLSGDSSIYNLLLPCGQCVGCRLERSRQWAVRIMHESKMHKSNCFITLTYNSDHCPKDYSLDYSHFQYFMRKLRRMFPESTIRFYMCGEYGEKNNRPHYHACIFGWSPPDLVLWRSTSQGHRLYRSAVLEKLWEKGFCSVGQLTFETAAYTARYIMKKRTGQRAVEYRVISESTGEIFSRVPEFNRMSLKPGIGATWFDKYGDTDVIPHDHVVSNGVPSKPPRYYDKLLAKRSKIVLGMNQQRRIDSAQVHAFDNRPSRREVKEAVAKAKIRSLIRSSF